MMATGKDIKWLKRYVDARFKAARDAVSKVESTNKEAVDKLEKTNSNYRDTQNEWRQQIKDQTAMFVTRRELWAAVLAIIAIVASLITVIKFR